MYEYIMHYYIILVGLQSVHFVRVNVIYYYVISVII